MSKSFSTVILALSFIFMSVSTYADGEKVVSHKHYYHHPVVAAAPSTPVPVVAPAPAQITAETKLPCAWPKCPNDVAKLTPLQPTPDNLKKVFDKVSLNLNNIVGQLNSMEWYATQPVPAAPGTPVVNPAPTLDPYAAQCLPALINFLQTVPTPASIPALPAGDTTGVLVDFEVVRIKAMLLDQLMNQFAQKGLNNTPLELACSAYIMNIKNLPFQIGLDFQTNMLNIINALSGIAP